MDKKKSMLYTNQQTTKQLETDIGGNAMVWVPKTRVVLVDDHDVVRKGIRNLLRKAPDIVVIGEASNGSEAIQLVNQLHPDVLLLDIEMPGMNGVDVVRRLEEAGMAVKILVLSAYDDQEYILEMLSSGASGYLLKEETPEYILEAVRGVASGQTGWVSSQVAKKLERMKINRRQEATLTFRELDILRLIAANESDVQIAQKLRLSEKALQSLVDFLLHKLDVKTREQAIEHARGQGWI